MAKASYATWTVLPHGPIERLESNLWRVEGSLPSMPLKRVMTSARLGSGDLVVHNPVALEESGMKEIDAFGRVAFLVVRNGWHRLDLHAFCTRYPTARVLAPKGALKPSPTFARFRKIESEGRTSVVLADAVFNMPHLHGFQGFVLRHLTQSSGGPRTSRIARLFMIKDRAAFAAHLERLATPKLRRVVVAHHRTIEDDPAGVLRDVARSLR